MHFACRTVVHQFIKKAIRYASSAVRVCMLLTSLITGTSEAILPDLLSCIMPYSTTAVTYSRKMKKLY